ncbi:MAG: rhomboid family intramembrane serine protease [Bacteroidia bacterium]
MIGPGGFGGLPTVIKNIILINALLFVATFLLRLPFADDLALYYPTSPNFNPYQLISYMFMHGGFMHILFNMLALYMFGAEIEMHWGPKRFLVYYIICGLGAALAHFGLDFYRFSQIDAQINALGGIENMLAQPEIARLVRIKEYIRDTPLVGASGSVFGILLAYGMMFPNRIIMPLFPPIPMKAKYFVMVYGAIELYAGFSNQPGDNVAHFAHIGGLITGFMIITFWKSQRTFY